MNKLSVVIVSAGVDLWDTLTVPAVKGLREFGDPNDEIIVVDNGGLGRGNVNINPLVPFATACNAGAREATGDRLLFINNDIIVSGPYRQHLGNAPIEGPDLWKPHGGWLAGWLLSIHRGLWDLLGGFDEQFRNSFEDVDFCWRAQRIGYTLHVTDTLPIEHLHGQTRRALKGIAEDSHDRNKELFYQKMGRMKTIWMARDR